MYSCRMYVQPIKLYKVSWASLFRWISSFSDKHVHYTLYVCKKNNFDFHGNHNVTRKKTHYKEEKCYVRRRQLDESPF